jgi:hypothetical protein
MIRRSLGLRDRAAAKQRRSQTDQQEVAEKTASEINVRSEPCHHFLLVVSDGPAVIVCLRKGWRQPMDGATKFVPGYFRCAKCGRHSANDSNSLRPVERKHRQARA